MLSSATLALILTSTVGAGTANASEYSKSAPRFDRLMMLRVAMAYNLSRNTVDLSFPATSEEACRIAGLGALTHIGKDHPPWANGPDGGGYRASVEAALGTFQAPCIWMLSDAASAAVPGVARVWEGATMKPNFKRLRRGLRKANCRTVYKALDRYPSVDLPADRVHQKVVTVMTRPCKKRRR